MDRGPARPSARRAPEPPTTTRSRSSPDARCRCGCVRPSGSSSSTTARWSPCRPRGSAPRTGGWSGNRRPAPCARRARPPWPVRPTWWQPAISGPPEPASPLGAQGRLRRRRAGPAAACSRSWACRVPTCSDRRRPPRPGRRPHRAGGARASTSRMAEQAAAPRRTGGELMSTPGGRPRLRQRQRPLRGACPRARRRRGRAHRRPRPRPGLPTGCSCPGSATSTPAWPACAPPTGPGSSRPALAGGRPVLGVCVGMQVLFDGSRASPPAAQEGLGEWPGTVARLQRRGRAAHGLERGRRPGRHTAVRRRRVRAVLLRPLVCRAGLDPGGPTGAFAAVAPKVTWADHGGRSSRRSRTARCPRRSSTPRSPATPGWPSSRTGCAPCEPPRRRRLPADHAQGHSPQDHRAPRPRARPDPNVQHPATHVVDPTAHPARSPPPSARPSARWPCRSCCEPVAWSARVRRCRPSCGRRLPLRPGRRLDAAEQPTAEIRGSRPSGTTCSPRLPPSGHPTH